MTLVLVGAWLLLAPVAGLIVGKAVRMADQGECPPPKDEATCPPADETAPSAAAPAEVPADAVVAQA